MPGCLPAVQRHGKPHVQLDRGCPLVLVRRARCGFSAPFADKGIPQD